MLRQVKVAVAALALLAMPAPAAELVSAGDIPSVTAALAAAGFTAELRRDDDGVRYLLVNDGPQAFSISFDACDDAVEATGCTLLIFDTSWDADSGFDIETANRFNQTTTLAHAFVDEDGVLVLTLAVTTSGGLTPANFAAVLAGWQAADAELGALIGEAPVPPGGVIVAGLSARSAAASARQSCRAGGGCRAGP